MFILSIALACILEILKKIEIGGAVGFKGGKQLILAAILSWALRSSILVVW
jgi:hypothetical protein